jgi:hypothetical protein
MPHAGSPGAVAFDAMLGSKMVVMVPQRGFEPLTHALRMRRSLLWIISINNLRIQGAVYGKEKRRKSACAGTKVATAKASGAAS